MNNGTAEEKLEKDIAIITKECDCEIITAPLLCVIMQWFETEWRSKARACVIAGNFNIGGSSFSDGCNAFRDVVLANIDRTEAV